VYERYCAAAQEVAREYSEAPPAPAPWGIQGYKGTCWGKASAGLRDDGAILQVSGSWASAARLLELPYTGVPRLDIQATVWGCPQPAMVPGDVAAASVAARAGRKGKPWKVVHLNGHGAGDTAYLGSRNSEMFVRVYDKGAESEGEAGYEGSVRYEAELSGGTAQEAFTALARVGADENACADRVQSYLLARGVSLPVWVSRETLQRRIVAKEASNADATLAWLASAVRPSIRRLIDEGLTYELLHRILFGLPSDKGLEWIEATDGARVVAISTKLRD